MKRKPTQRVLRRRRRAVRAVDDGELDELLALQLVLALGLQQPSFKRFKQAST